MMRFSKLVSIVVLCSMIDSVMGLGFPQDTRPSEDKVQSFDWMNTSFGAVKNMCPEFTAQNVGIGAAVVLGLIAVRKLYNHYATSQFLKKHGTMYRNVPTLAQFSEHSLGKLAFDYFATKNQANKVSPKAFWEELKQHQSSVAFPSIGKIKMKQLTDQTIKDQAVADFAENTKTLVRILEISPAIFDELLAILNTDKEPSQKISIAGPVPNKIDTLITTIKNDIFSQAPLGHYKSVKDLLEKAEATSFFVNLFGNYRERARKSFYKYLLESVWLAYLSTADFSK